MQNDKGTKSIQSVNQALGIIDFLLEQDGATIGEVADHMNMADSSAYRYLHTLKNHGYVVCENNQYNLGLPFLRLSNYVQHRKKEFTLVEPIIDELAETTGERCQFYVLENNAIVSVYRSIGERAVLTDSKVGKRLPVHATSAGKAIVSALPEEKAERIITECEFEQETENTITDPMEFREELNDIRELGVSYNMEEYISGLVGVSVPIMADDDRVAGSLTVSGPAKRLKMEYIEENILNILLGLANELELKIQYE